jgi:anaerobic ribonucleoside-triphosphate reductase activating protein
MSEDTLKNPLSQNHWIRVGGVTRLTATDFPGKLAAVVFLQGCPWRCGYCHNPHLLAREGNSQIAWSDVQEFLKRRQGLLDAVVFSGGEPTQQESLLDAVFEVRQWGYRVGLHTGGAYPERLERLIPLLDWVGMDFKISFDDYEKITRVPHSGARARESAKLLIASSVSYEFRTTLHPIHHTDDVILRGAEELSSLGAKSYFLQEFRSKVCSDPSLQNHGLKRAVQSLHEKKSLTHRLECLFPTFGIRSESI